MLLYLCNLLLTKMIITFCVKFVLQHKTGTSTNNVNFMCVFFTNTVFEIYISYKS